MRMWVVLLLAAVVMLIPAAVGAEPGDDGDTPVSNGQGYEEVSKDREPEDLFPERPDMVSPDYQGEAGSEPVIDLPAEPYAGEDNANVNPEEFPAGLGEDISDDVAEAELVYALDEPQKSGMSTASYVGFGVAAILLLVKGVVLVKRRVKPAP